MRGSPPCDFVKISQSDRTKRMHYLACYTVTWYFTYNRKECRSTPIKITCKIKALSKNVTPNDKALKCLRNDFMYLFITSFSQQNALNEKDVGVWQNFSRTPIINDASFSAGGIWWQKFVDSSTWQLFKQAGLLSVTSR